MKTPLFAKSYKQQNMLLVAVTGLLLFAVFNLSIKRTLKVYENYSYNRGQVTLAANAPAEIAKLKERLGVLQATYIKPYQREILLEKITSFSTGHDLLVKSFPEAKTLENNGANVVTNHIEVEGGYMDMVKLLFDLEETEMLGSVSSVKFNLVKDRQQKKTVLRSSIILRNLENPIPDE